MPALPLARAAFHLHAHLTLARWQALLTRPSSPRPLLPRRPHRRAAIEAVTAEVNAHAEAAGQPPKSVDEVAMGFLRVANETMCRPIRALTQMKVGRRVAHGVAVARLCMISSLHHTASSGACAVFTAKRRWPVFHFSMFQSITPSGCVYAVTSKPLPGCRCLPGCSMLQRIPGSLLSCLVRIIHDGEASFPPLSADMNRWIFCTVGL